MNRQNIEDKLKELHGVSFGWAMICCGRNRHLATDALQTSYLKVLEGKARFKGKSSFKTWFFAIIRNTSIDMMKANAFLKVHTTDIENAAEMIVDSSTDKIRVSMSFDRALAQLSDKQRELMHLIFYQDLTLDEAAKLMNVSRGTVRQHYHRAKTKLKKLLK